MATLIAGAVAVFVLYTLLQMFRSANPAVMARGIKIAGGLVALAVAVFVGIKGELAVAIPLGIFGVRCGPARLVAIRDQRFQQYRRAVWLIQPALVRSDIPCAVALPRYDARPR